MSKETKPFKDIDQWHLARWGNFTCSLNDKLVDKGATSLFSAAGYNYIKQKAVESTSRLEERPELEEVKSLLWGKVHEYPAFEAYITATNNKFLTYLGTETPLYLEYEPLKDDCGGSPDIINITPSYSIDFLAETKCPKNPSIHFDRLKWKDQWDVKENYREAYTQIQNLMMITECQYADFISYDGRQLSKKHRIKVISIKKDQKFQDNLHFKLTSAISQKYKIISEHLEQDIRNKSDLKRYFSSQ
jgi:hypothetical protein